MSRRLIAWLLVGQAAAFAGWWVVVVNVPASRPYFGDANLMTFWLADAAVIVVTLAAAFAVWRKRWWAGAAAWAVAGATGYAALYGIAHAIATGSAWLGVALMVPSAIVAMVLARAGARS